MPERRRRVLTPTGPVGNQLPRTAKAVRGRCWDMFVSDGIDPISTVTKRKRVEVVVVPPHSPYQIKLHAELRRAVAAARREP